MSRRLPPILLALSLGCATTGTDLPGEVTYADDAKQNHDLGRRALEAGRHLEALKYFEHVRNKYPYSSFAALADLGIADTHFEREKYTEAIDAYKSFVKLHPTHPDADYAKLRVGLSHYKEIPSDFILFPPSSQKDQSPVHGALYALEDFLRAYPESKRVPEAKNLIADVRRRMAAHEMYVADFYLQRERHRAAVGRLNKVVEEFHGLGFDGEALLKLAKSYIALDEKKKAREALERIVRELPNDSHRTEAERLLRGLS